MNSIQKASEIGHLERLSERVNDAELRQYYLNRIAALRKSAALATRQDEIEAATQRYLAELKRLGVNVSGAEIDYQLKED